MQRWVELPHHTPILTQWHITKTLTILNTQMANLGAIVVILLKLVRYITAPPVCMITAQAVTQKWPDQPHHTLIPTQCNIMSSWIILSTQVASLGATVATALLLVRFTIVPLAITTIVLTAMPKWVEQEHTPIIILTCFKIYRRLMILLIQMERTTVTIALRNILERCTIASLVIMTIAQNVTLLWPQKQGMPSRGAKGKGWKEEKGGGKKVDLWDHFDVTRLAV